MSGSADTDQLLLNVAAEMPGAVDALFDRHRARLLAMVQTRMDSQLRRRVDPSDVIQEAWITASAGLADYVRDRPIRFYPWLRAIAIERLIDLHRKHVVARGQSVRREVEGGLSVSKSGWRSLAVSVADSNLEPDRRVSLRERAAQLENAIEQLPVNDREIIVLRHIEGLSVAETADVLGIPEGTVKSRHFRILARLQTRLRALE